MTTRFWIAAVSLSVTSFFALRLYKRSSQEAKIKKSCTQSTARADSTSPPVPVLPSHLQRVVHKDARRNKMIPKLALKRTMYENIQMLDIEGELLCNISKKKAMWYVQKELADWVEQRDNEGNIYDQRQKIQLSFEPKGHSIRGEMGVYIKAQKCNVCVGCGNSQHLMKHYVVPFCYRNLFPDQYKSHMSHDIVILCPKCHLHCDRATQHRQNQLEKTLRTNPDSALAFLTDHYLYQTRSMALALLRWKAKLPLSTLEEYKDLVRMHLKLAPSDELTPELLQRAIDVEYKVPNAEYIPGAKLVVESLVSTDQIDHFVQGWRRHFCEVIQPRFLPEGWSVDSPASSD